MNYLSDEDELPAGAYLVKTICKKLFTKGYLQKQGCFLE